MTNALEVSLKFWIFAHAHVVNQELQAALRKQAHIGWGVS
jgi:hypothetical protein